MGGVQQSETRLAIGISVLCSVIILVLFLGFRDFIGINVRHEFQKQ